VQQASRQGVYSFIQPRDEAVCEQWDPEELSTWFFFNGKFFLPGVGDGWPLPWWVGDSDSYWVH
jgi:hypothetical protein